MTARPLTLALYQPEIAANLGAAIRIAACFGADLSVIEPCGFPWKTKDINRVAMDYGDLATPVRHGSFEAFRAQLPGRLLLLSTKGDTIYSDVSFVAGDTILLGQESAGVPAAIHDIADGRLRVPMAGNARSLNMAVTGAIALSEARRQIGW